MCRGLTLWRLLEWRCAPLGCVVEGLIYNN